MRTVTSPMASMPRVMALTENSVRSPWTDTTSSTALYAASTGPVPVAQTTWLTPSSSEMVAVAVGTSGSPQETCRASSV